MKIKDTILDTYPYAPTQFEVEAALELLTDKKLKVLWERVCFERSMLAGALREIESALNEKLGLCACPPARFECEPELWPGPYCVTCRCRRIVAANLREMKVDV